MTGLNGQRILEFVARHTGSPRAEVSTVPLAGGIDSPGVYRLAVTWTGNAGNACSRGFVLKHLQDHGLRELSIYTALRGTAAAGAMPRLLGVDFPGPGQAYMYIELLHGRETAWPWANLDASVAVLRQLAEVHTVCDSGLSAVRDWDYDADLRRSAQSTIELFVSTLRLGIDIGHRPMLRPLERIAATLPAMRSALASWHRPALLHGDAHSGNIGWRRDRDGRLTAVLLDWGRARIGSPLEDLSSWLQSLGCWEPEVRRRHDTLFRSYLNLRRMPDRLSPELRQLYWMAAACNAMAGALRYHLVVLSDITRPGNERADAWHALIELLRVVRRADASWRN